MKDQTMLPMSFALLMMFLTSGLCSPAPAEGSPSEGGFFNTFFTDLSSVLFSTEEGAACNETILESTDLKGFDLFDVVDGKDVPESNNKVAEDEKECREICRGKEGCRAWTFVDNWKVKCLLKKEVTGKEETLNSNFVSGNVCR